MCRNGELDSCWNWIQWSPADHFLIFNVALRSKHIINACNKQTMQKGFSNSLGNFDQLTVCRLYTQCQKKPLSNLSPDPYFLGDSDVTRPFGQHTEFSEKQKGEPTLVFYKLECNFNKQKHALGVPNRDAVLGLCGENSQIGGGPLRNFPRNKKVNQQCLVQTCLPQMQV